MSKLIQLWSGTLNLAMMKCNSFQIRQIWSLKIIKSYLAINTHPYNSMLWLKIAISFDMILWDLWYYLMVFYFYWFNLLFLTYVVSYFLQFFGIFLYVYICVCIHYRPQRHLPYLYGGYLADWHDPPPPAPPQNPPLITLVGIRCESDAKSISIQLYNLAQSNWWRWQEQNPNSFSIYVSKLHQ